MFPWRGQKSEWEDIAAIASRVEALALPAHAVESPAAPELHPAPWHSEYRMNRCKTDELAAILVNQYGRCALAHAKARLAQHAHQPRSEAFRTWNSIAAATARLLRIRLRRKIRFR
jgi:hypothetical protein